MKEFAALIQALERTNKTNTKIELIADYFNNADERDLIWVLAFFTGKRPKRAINTTILRETAIAAANIPKWLFEECYHNVGDLSETIALLLPDKTIDKKNESLPLYEWIHSVLDAGKLDDEEKTRFLIKSWAALNKQERFVFNKLISGNFRIGVSSKTLINALARIYEKPSTELQHIIMGKWNPQTTNYSELMQGSVLNADVSWPYPFCLAYPLEGAPKDLGDEKDWVAEWKWDGIRGQVIKRNNEVFIWSRGEDLVTTQFPELVQMAQALPNGTVLDGEIIVMENNKVQPFNLLQQRLNRKTISAKLLLEAPIHFISYDLLEHEGKDCRNRTFIERKNQLIQIVKKLNNASLNNTENLAFDNWKDLDRWRQKAKEINSEGLMLKQIHSLYHTGRKKGDWWKWKIEPYTIDTVLLYAQKGSGRRSNFYTDFTFGVRDGENFITIAKAYSGLTDAEIKEVNKFIRNNAVEKFGPVRTVKPELVFEIAFEGILTSNRHKAGVALRFPRIKRWRHDKAVAEIDTLENVKTLLLNKSI